MKPRLMMIAGALAVGGMMLGADAQQKKRRRKGTFNTPPARGERSRDKLKVGDKAPDFTLPDLTGKTEITLSSYRGKKPVVLIFASCT